MIYVAGLLLALQFPVAQQGDGLSYQVPAGWDKAADPNSGVVSLTPPGLPLLRVVKVNVPPPEQFSGTAAQYHDDVVRRAASAGRLAEPPRSGSVGSFLTTRLHQIAPNGIHLWTTLYTARWSDRGQVILFASNAADVEQRYLAVVNAMVSGIALPQTVVAAPPPPTAGPATPSAPGAGSIGDYVYTIPAGWTRASSSQGIALHSPTSETGEICTLAMWPMMRSSGDLVRDAVAASRQLFSSYGTPTNGAATISRGVSAQGWAYVVLAQGLDMRGSIDPGPHLFGMVMVANLGDHVATISWLSKAQLYGSCFYYRRSDDLPEVWPRFFSTLQFRNWTASANGFDKGIAGVWESIGTSTGGGAAIQYTFTPVKRYAFMGVGQRYMDISRYEAAVWTSTAFGDGSYSLRGNELTLTPDRGGKPDVYFVRLEQVSSDGGRSWTEKLYMMSPSRNCNMNGCGDHDGDMGLTRRKP